MLSDGISEHQILKNFPGGACPQTPLGRPLTRFLQFILSAPLLKNIFLRHWGVRGVSILIYTSVVFSLFDLAMIPWYPFPLPSVDVSSFSSPPAHFVSGPVLELYQRLLFLVLGFWYFCTDRSIPFSQIIRLVTFHWEMPPQLLFQHIDEPFH